jgi:hypothetical protein
MLTSGEVEGRERLEMPLPVLLVLQGAPLALHGDLHALVTEGRPHLQGYM